MCEGWGKVPERLLDAARLARSEGRLDWRLTDASGRPANGGSAEPLAIGEWSELVENVKLCSRGWHTTNDPLRWGGCRGAPTL